MQGAMGVECVGMKCIIKERAVFAICGNGMLGYSRPPHGGMAQNMSEKRSLWA